jgi:hypothetical protein
MRWASVVCAAGFVMLGPVPGACRAGGVNDFLAKDGTLKQPLRLTVGGTNIAGVFGSVWEIDPRGRWTKKSLRSEALEAKGELTARQLAALAEHLAAQDFNKLPAKFGHGDAGPDGGNVAMIAFGKKQASYEYYGSLFAHPPRPGTAEARHWARFVALALALQQMLEDPRALIVARWLSDDAEKRPAEFLKDGTVKIGYGKRDGKWLVAAGRYAVSPRGLVEGKVKWEGGSLRLSWVLTEDGCLVSPRGGDLAVRWVRAKEDEPSK